jgi:streptogramin lyase
MSTDTQVQIGTDFVGYRIEALIGRGGMGVVYRAYDLRLRRTVALKLLAPHLAVDDRFRARFVRESELAMSLEHPHVVPIYDAGDVDGRLYLAMRLVEGTDLRALLRAEGKLEPARGVSIAGQVGNALDAAHAEGLVHRDVKPSNVLLDRDEHVYLADLGLTRRLEELGPPVEERSVGTPAYLAPEQIEGRPIDGRADVYSLGCLLYECLTGATPFRADSRLAAAWAHLEEEPPSASERNPDLPPAIDGVVRKALAKAPDERYPTCAALICDAESAVGLRQPSGFRRGRLLALAAAAILVLVAAAVAATLVLRGDANVSASAVRPNTLVRIDPARNVITDVIRVGPEPAATAVGGRSVWVYNAGVAKITEIDAGSDAIVQRVRLSAVPANSGRLTGPVLDADEAAAWVVGVNRRGDGFLTRIFSRRGGMRDYPLDVEPKGVALGEGAVWVLGHGNRGDQVLRVDPGTGEVRARTPFPASVQVDSLTVGLRAVWAVASSGGILYRVDPRSSKLDGRLELGGRAGRPVVRFGDVWVPVLGQYTLIVDPRTLKEVNFLCCPERGPTATGNGSTWMADEQAGEVVRFDGRSKQPVVHIPMGSPLWGPCLSSIAAGAGAIWVTVGPSVADSHRLGMSSSCRAG